MVEARDKAVVVGHGGWTRHGRSEAGGMTKTGAAAAAFRWLGNSQGIITSCKNPDAIMAWLSRGDSTPTPQAPSLSLSALLSSLSIIMSRTSGVPRKNSGDPHPCRKPLTATSTSVWTGPDFASSSSSSSTTTTKQQQEAHVHDCRPQGARNSSTLPWCRATRTPPPHFVRYLCHPPPPPAFGAARGWTPSATDSTPAASKGAHARIPLFLQRLGKLTSQSVGRARPWWLPVDSWTTYLTPVYSSYSKGKDDVLALSI
ncbi:uncharacterized protein IWZ02DRAFT_287863 [Phyllosticta citriasiana]|uniref:uncharacterized protein n=1 Tax=Phyllosticta citriasiana TaxID=595635 RepID=UPI0030FDB8B8